MKVNQNDLIISIVAVVLGLGFSAAFFFMKRVPIAPAPSPAVITTQPALPVGSVVMANALPGGGSAQGGGGGFGSPPGGGSFGIGARGAAFGAGGSAGGGSRPMASGAAGGPGGGGPGGKAMGGQ
jgi:hypothetical protein